MSERYVAAVEISSSKIVVAVGKVREDGQLDVLASEQEKGLEGVKYGVIQNLEETSMRMRRIVERLERKPVVAPREITGVYVGLSARSLRSICTEVTVNLPDDVEIDDDIMERLRRQALTTAIDSSLEVIDAVPRIYRVGKIVTDSPKGMVGNRISGKFDLIVCRPEVKRNLVKVIQDKLGIEIKGLVVTALSAAQLILTNDEKRLGCMLVDMGAETTTVSIYKEGHLSYFATLPLGGRNITRDLTNGKDLKLLEEKAEEIKITTGNAMPRENVSTLNYNGVRDCDVSNYIVARSEEIVANILEQISYAEFKENDLPGGIICIGGGSKLNGIIDLLAQESGLPVKRGQFPAYIRVEDTKSSSLEMVEVVSVLYSGAMNNDAECLTVPSSEELPITGEANHDEPVVEVKRRPDKPSIFKKWGEKISGMFGGDVEDDSAELD